MRKMWFTLLPPLSIMIAVALIFRPVNLLSAEPFFNDTTISAPQESIGALSPGLASNHAVITAPKTVLPGHVYVLNNHEIVTEKPTGEWDNSCSTAEEPSSHRRTISSTTEITASFTVLPSRLIVVDEYDRIVEIWSNTTGLKRSFYSLRVKEQSLQGPAHLLTPGILAQYNCLLGEVDWSNEGKVY